MRPAELAARLEHDVLLLDGGMGSMLISAGLPAGRAPEWWNLEHPERVAAVHTAYAAAGCQLVHTNTFGGSPPRLAEGGLGGRCHEVNAAAAALAREAVPAGVLIAGDLGPTGRLLPPLGDASEAELEAAFAEQAAALAATGVDLLSIETMSDLREAVAAVGAARATGLAVMASMTFALRPRGAFTVMGDPLVASLAALVAAGATAVGANCTVTADVMLAMVGEAAPALAAPLAAQPNAGQPRLEGDSVVYDADPADFGRRLSDLAAAGARLVGGCCGTTPAFIQAAHAALGRGTTA